MTDARDAVSQWPQWIQLLLAALTGAAIAITTLIRLGFSFNSRLQRIENQDLNQIVDARIEEWYERRGLVRQEGIDARIAVDRHNNLYPMMQTRIFGPIDKLEDELKLQGQNIAVLLERDRTTQALQEVLSTSQLVLNQLKSK